MKKLVYLLFTVLFVLGNLAASAQTFITNSGALDTVKGYLSVGPDVKIQNPIKSASTPVAIKTTVQYVSIPSGVTAQFCDNFQCNNVYNAGYTSYSMPYPATYGASSTYYAEFQGMASAPSGSTAVMTVRAWDSANNFQRTLTFIAYRDALGVKTQVMKGDDVFVYPNPARDAVNVLYDENAGVKKIAIYNLIGKMMKAFIPMDNNSAKLDIDNIPTGVYFIRLMDAQNHVLSTRRFTRQ